MMMIRQARGAAVRSTGVEREVEEAAVAAAEEEEEEEVLVVKEEEMVVVVVGHPLLWDPHSLSGRADSFR